MSLINRTINTLINSAAAQYCSALTVQAGQRLNISIRPGASLVSDPTLSVVSAVFVLQRKLSPANGETVEDDLYRDVQSWAVALADLLAGGTTESITSNPEPETCEYRLGVKANEWASGAAFVRLGTN